MAEARRISTPSKVRRAASVGGLFDPSRAITFLARRRVDFAVPLRSLAHRLESGAVACGTFILGQLHDWPSHLHLSGYVGDQLFAKGDSYRSEDRYNPDHIESLSPEVRDAVMHQCSTPRALREFSAYTDNLQTIVLHFEHLSCGTGGTFCGPAGCLHQIYVSSHGHYRLLRIHYTPEWQCTFLPQAMRR